jgi:hypothetical protein
MIIIISRRSTVDCTEKEIFNGDLKSTPEKKKKK